MVSIDLNSDLVESFGVYRIGYDDELFPAALQCKCCVASTVAIRARWNELWWPANRTASASVHTQDFPIWSGLDEGRSPGHQIEPIPSTSLATDAFCRAAGVQMQHVKPHGALTNMAQHDAAISEAIVAAVKSFDQSLLLFAMPGSEL